MDDHLVRFIADLRAAGVRISLAESQDAARALAQLDTLDRETFRAALQTTLIKEHTDEPIFDKLFPLYFAATPTFLSPEQALSPDQQQMLEEALRAMVEDSSRLLQQLASGQSPTYQELSRYAQQAKRNPILGLLPRAVLAREMLRQMGMAQLDAQVAQLSQQLAAQGMGLAGVQGVQGLIGANQAALTELAGQFVQQAATRQLPALFREALDTTDLMLRSFDALSEAEAHALRQEVKRLGRKLRSRAALRQKKGAGKTLDAKTTLRANLRTGGIPFHLHFKKKHLKPKFVLICDVSTSMRPAAEFMLRLMYEMQDQITKVRSFAFNRHLEEVTDEFVQYRPDKTIPHILRRIPPGYYATDLGGSLADFCEHFMDAVDRHTTVIVLGDGRNNTRDPRLDLFEQIKRRARQIVWFNPEPRSRWGTGDSDMLRYTPFCIAVHQIRNLAQLTEAVDKLFTAH
jgi:uncharacterized protein with von Willebrand factor type A (vWA) domain